MWGVAGCRVTDRAGDPMMTIVDGHASQHTDARLPACSIRPQYALDWTSRSCDVQQCCEDAFTAGERERREGRTDCCCCWGCWWMVVVIGGD